MKLFNQTTPLMRSSGGYFQPSHFHPALKLWSQFKNGQWLADSIQARLDEWSPRLFGYHLVKMGSLSENLSMNNCSIPHQVNLDFGTCFEGQNLCSFKINGISENQEMPNLVADAFELPLLEKSVDVVLLAHQLDYCLDPHRLLREVDRTIIDDGYLIITGFNSLSLAGMGQLLPWRKAPSIDSTLKGKQKLSWGGRWFTPHRVNDWLSLLNYQVLDSNCYALFPVSRYQNGWTWLENSLGSWTEHFGCAYFIIARKRTCPLTPAKPFWHFKPALSTANVN